MYFLLDIRRCRQTNYTTRASAIFVLFSQDLHEQGRSGDLGLDSPLHGTKHVRGYMVVLGGRINKDLNVFSDANHT